MNGCCFSPSGMKKEWIRSEEEKNEKRLQLQVTRRRKRRDYDLEVIDRRLFNSNCTQLSPLDLRNNSTSVNDRS